MPTPEIRRARELVLRYGWNAMAYQILNPGMRLWFPADGEGVAGYVHAGNYRVVAGSPGAVPAARAARRSTARIRATRASTENGLVT